MKNKIIYIVIILLLASGVAYYIWRDIQNVEHRVSNISEQPEQTEQVQIEQIEQVKLPDAPNLDKPIKNLANLDETAFNIAVDKINNLRKELKENADLFDEWLSLGIYYKMVGDYNGAAEVWEYASVIRPNSSTPFGNLGDLYGYYIKDKVKAEKNFLKALEIDSTSIYLYRNIADFYRFVMKDVEKAKEVLRTGIKLNPDSSQDLKDLLNEISQ